MLRIVILLVISIAANAQHNRYWFFGNGAGLDFSGTSPAVVTGGQSNNTDCSSTVSDASGNLLFYSNGVNVWNRNHQVMANGTGLSGHPSAGQCALIVPVPCSQRYVIFHVTEFSSPGKLHYTVVDMSLASGLGDVIPSQKNISLGTGWTEKLCAIYEPSGGFYWLLTHKWNSSDFVAFKITGSSIATQSVVSSIGSAHSCGSYGAVHDAMGELTISPDGTKIANALTCQDKYELFNFNQLTGAVSNPVTINGNGKSAWGLAFSPDSKLLYTSDLFGPDIVQYNTNVFTANAITNSKLLVGSTMAAGYQFGYMELAADGKIYIAKPNSGFLSAVMSPNTIGMLCNFQVSAVSLGPNSSSWGVSRMAIGSASASAGPLTVASAPAGFTVCAGKQLTLTASGCSGYTWSNGAQAASVALSPTVTSNITVAGTGNGCTYSSVLTVSVIAPSSTVSLISLPSGSICAGNQFTLTASGASSYSWSTGAQGSNTEYANLSGVYQVSATTSNGCVSSASMMLNVVSPGSSISIAPVQWGPCTPTVVLFAQGMPTYTWNTGAQSGAVVVSPTVTTSYTVTGTATNGCNSSTIIILPGAMTPPLLSIAASHTERMMCEGETATLTAFGAQNYTWSTGAMTNAITVSPNSFTTFTITGAGVNNCTATASISLIVTPCTDILSQTQNAKPVVFPVPASNIISVCGFSLDQHASVRFISSNGETLQHEDFAMVGGCFKIGLSQLPPAVYLLQIESNGSLFTRRIIVAPDR